MMEDAISKLQEQQSRFQARSPQWMVAQQLMDLVRAEPQCAQLLARDLEVEAMSIAEAEKKIKAFADSHRTGGFACVTPAESDRILREFYGLPLDAIIGMYQAILPSSDSLIKCLTIFNMPFTFCKGMLDVALCFLVYKPLSPLLHK